MVDIFYSNRNDMAQCKTTWMKLWPVLYSQMSFWTSKSRGLQRFLPSLMQFPVGYIHCFLTKTVNFWGAKTFL